MNFFKNLFQKNLIECPRCLGKGNVEQSDIIRLKKELYWAPGKCAYCKGNGKVSKEQAQKLSPDFAYLTLDISEEETNRLFDNDVNAHQRAKQFEHDANVFVRQIEFLHFVGGMTIEKIIDFLYLDSDKTMVSEEDIANTTNYVTTIIRLRKERNN